MSGRTEVLRVLALAGAVFALSLRRVERHLVSRLTAGGATEGINAAGPSGLTWRERLMLRRLIWGGAVGVLQHERYYLDPAGYAAFQKRRRVRAAAVLGLVLLFAAVAWWRSR